MDVGLSAMPEGWCGASKGHWILRKQSCKCRSADKRCSRGRLGRGGGAARDSERQQLPVQRRRLRHGAQQRRRAAAQVIASLDIAHAGRGSVLWAVSHKLQQGRSAAVRLWILHIPGQSGRQAFLHTLGGGLWSAWILVVVWPPAIRSTIQLEAYRRANFMHGRSGQVRFWADQCEGVHACAATGR